MTRYNEKSDCLQPTTFWNFSFKDPSSLFDLNAWDILDIKCSTTLHWFLENTKVRFVDIAFADLMDKAPSEKEDYGGGCLLRRK